MEDKEIVAKEIREAGADQDAAYLLVNDNTGQYYFGSTNEPIRRYQQHFNALQKGTHQNKLLQEAYNKDPDFKYIVTPVDSRSDAHIFENLNIAEFYDDPNNLNIMPAFSVSYIDREYSIESKEVMSLASKERWKDPEFREMMISASKARWEDPDYRKAMLEAQQRMISEPDYFERTSERIKAQWTPEMREQQAERASEMWKDPATAEIISDKVKASWTEERRQTSSEMNKAMWADPELLKRGSEMSKERWQDPEYRQQQAEIWADPEHQEKHRQATISAMQRPEVRAKVEETFIKVSIDGVVYPSMSEAARAIGVSASTIHYQLNVAKHPRGDWHYVT